MIRSPFVGSVTSLVAAIGAAPSVRSALLPAASHGPDHATRQTSWSRGVAILGLVVGVVLVGIGVFLDRGHEGDPRSDVLIVVGTLLSLLAMAVVSL